MCFQSLLIPQTMRLLNRNRLVDQRVRQLSQYIFRRSEQVQVTTQIRRFQWKHTAILLFLFL
jgi:hypothetical protein